MKPSVFASACLFMTTVGPFHMTDSFTPVSYSHLNRFAHIQCDRDDCSDTELRMGKNSNLARTEKNLEEMMGDDWRLFRARLVSQEQQGIRTNDNQNNHKSHHQHQHHGQQPRSLSREFHPDPDDKHQARQAHIANVFAGAIASIFSPKDGDHEHIHDIHDHTDFEDEPEIGAADLYACEDPFASEEEIVATTIRSNTNVNKHRWAHPISHVEPGCVLVANEKLGGVFHQTVVLIIDHHEATGSTGIVINRYIPSIRSAN